jgi:hypothetical protein
MNELFKIEQKELEEIIEGTKRTFSNSVNPIYDSKNNLDIINHLCERMSDLVLTVLNPKSSEKDIRRIAFYTGIIGYLSCETRSDKKTKTPSAATTWFDREGINQIEFYLKEIGYFEK